MCNDSGMPAAVTPTISVTHYSDPGCPWAYSASPALAVLAWRYGDQLDGELVPIGLAEDPQLYVDRGYTPDRQAKGYLGFRRYGMPFATGPRTRVVATGRACRAIVATRLLAPELEYAVFRALQFTQFCTTSLFDTDEGIAAALAQVHGLDAETVLTAIDTEATEEAYQADRVRTRTAAGSPTEFQGKAAQSDGPVRFTAPSVQFTHRDGRTLEAGGFQPLEAYDVCIANLDVSLERRPAAATAVDALRAFPYGLTTAEVAAIMAPHLTAADTAHAEESLIEAVHGGQATRTALGDDALWQAA
jgi:protein-disulfide isomerase-like protein with CxxC motif